MAWFNEDPALSPQEPPSWAVLVRCTMCGEVYASDQLWYDVRFERWCCRSWPECLGDDRHIRVVESGGPDAMEQR